MTWLQDVRISQLPAFKFLWQCESSHGPGQATIPQSRSIGETRFANIELTLGHQGGTHVSRI